MTYTHLTTDKLVLIESYYHQSKRITFVADVLKRSRQTIYNVYNGLNEGESVLDYYQKYKGNKKNVVDILFYYLRNKRYMFKRKLLKVGHQT